MARARSSQLRRHDGVLRAYRPMAGHYDELLDEHGTVRRQWSELIATLDDLSFEELERRQATAVAVLEQRRIVYRRYDAGRSIEMPWPLSFVPYVFDQHEWHALTSALIQRAGILEAILADAYGPAKLAGEGVLPAATLASDPEFLRPLTGIRPAGGRHLTIYAADLGRSLDGTWRVLRDRTQAPSGLGYALATRQSTAAALDGLRPLPGAANCQNWYEQLSAALDVSSTGGLKCLWSPGPLNETYCDQLLLAGHLDLRLVEGADLYVQHGRLYLRTIKGLECVDTVLRRLDSDFADPLTLRSSSRLGIPGLLQAVRAGLVALSNSLGSGLTESVALAPYLQSVARHLDGTPLDLDTANIANGAQNDRHTLSTMPVWSPGGLIARPFSLRVFAVNGPDGWHVMPGGLCLIADGSNGQAVSLQDGASCADVFVPSPAPSINNVTALRAKPIEDLTSRAADNLFWLGRYLERAIALHDIMAALAEHEAAGTAQRQAEELAELLTHWSAAPWATPRLTFWLALTGQKAVTSLPHVLASVSMAAKSLGPHLAVETEGLIQAVIDTLDGVAGRPLPDGPLSGLLPVEFARSGRLRAITAGQVTQLGPMAGAFFMLGRHIERTLTGCRLHRRAARDASAADAILPLLAGPAGIALSIPAEIQAIGKLIRQLPAPPSVDWLHPAATAAALEKLSASILDTEAAVIERPLMQLSDELSMAYFTRRDLAVLPAGQTP